MSGRPGLAHGSRDLAGEIHRPRERPHGNLAGCAQRLAQPLPSSPHSYLGPERAVLTAGGLRLTHSRLCVWVPKRRR